VVFGAAVLGCAGQEPAGGSKGVSRGAAGNVAAPGSTLPPAASVDMSQPVSPIVPMSMPVQTEDECNKVAIEFAPKVPAVFILVDRSSSMFERSLWDPLKQGVLAVVQQLEGEMRFGFSSYTGERDRMCPELSMIVPVAESNYAAIERAYNSIERPQFKGETPTSLALSAVSETLLQEPADDPKYIVLVTDGEPDFCDDPNVTCSRDAVVAAAQEAFARGVGTFVFSIGGEVDRSHLGDLANAGVGLPVEDRQMAVMYQCPERRGTYGTTTGSAPFFEPDVSDQQALVAALSGAIAGVRSCIFDLQGKVQIDLTMADQGLVTIDGEPVTYGAPDGFRMNSPTQLELLGAACTRLKQPETMRVSIDFPCKAIELL
jgi:hypothetical protein